MGTGRKLLFGIVCVLALGLLLPSLAAAQAAICEPCTVNADCASGSCGVAADGSRKCIPAGVATYECAVDDDTCFIMATDLFRDPAKKYQVYPE